MLIGPVRSELLDTCLLVELEGGLGHRHVEMLSAAVQFKQGGWLAGCWPKNTDIDLGASRAENQPAMAYVSRGFRGRRREGAGDRLPPGQYEATDFPVLSAGPTPHVPTDRWTFAITGEVATPKMWTWEEFRGLPSEPVRCDIHCVTKWSKLDTEWEGVSVDTLLAEVEHQATHVLAISHGGYTTNLPLADVVDGKAWVAFAYGAEPLEPAHGGPARLLVPHLYLWKSAKWVRELRLLDHDEPGFWETYGYHMYGDPWREQRYSGD